MVASATELPGVIAADDLVGAGGDAHQGAGGGLRCRSGLRLGAKAFKAINLVILRFWPCAGVFSQTCDIMRRAPTFRVTVMTVVLFSTTVDAPCCAGFVVDGLHHVTAGRQVQAR